MGRKRWTEEMREDVIERRERGETFQRLGERYGISRERMRQVYGQSKRRLARLREQK